MISPRDWKPIEKEFISKEGLEGWVKDYFGKFVSLSNFESRNGEWGLELMKKDGSEGYVFVGPLQLDRDFRKRMETSRESYVAQGRVVLREFVDRKAELAGFYWRAS